MTVKMSEEMAESRERKISSIINEYGSRLFRFVRGRVPSNADAEDITQEVWYQLSRVLEIDSIEQVSGWIFRVAKNRITDNFRKQKPDLLEDKNLENDNGSFNFTEILMAETTSPEDENLKELFWFKVSELTNFLMSNSGFKALDELPENQRNVFVWNELEDETFQEIADRTGENIKTLISRKRYAVQHLRVKLEELCGEFFDKN
jgi:RNA polymerase sigma factor (sigma-70 family)